MAWRSGTSASDEPGIGAESDEGRLKQALIVPAIAAIVNEHFPKTPNPNAGLSALSSKNSAEQFTRAFILV